MTKIIRTKTKATGGITPAEKVALKKHTELWIKRAMRTNPIEIDKITPAIKGLYKAAGLEEPRVVIVSSPMVMAFAYGASAAIWYLRNKIATSAATDAATDAATSAATDAATSAATSAATDDATYTAAATSAATAAATSAATDAATYAATRAATSDATDAATYAATRGATSACFKLSGQFGRECAKKWWRAYQGGNMWPGYDCYLTAMRDVIGLDLPEYKNYEHWEQVAIHGGFRVIHEKFCIVSDFPEFIKTDENNQPHCENGPSHRWSDGWSLYHWHGVKVPGEWIENPEGTNPADVIACKNVETRAAGCEILGWDRMAPKLNRKIIDGDPDTDIGALVELTLPGLPEAGRFLMAQCPRNGLICEGIPRVSDIDDKPINTAIAAQAWRDCLPQSEYSHATLRT